MNLRQRVKPKFKLVYPLLALGIALPTAAYDSPLSPDAIRDAYFLGTREGGLTPEFLKPYSHWVSDLHQGNCTTRIRLETPFLQVADSTSKMVNYSSQDAVKDFYDKPLTFRIFVDVCSMQEASPPGSVEIKAFQNKKQIAPLLDTRSPDAEPINETGFFPPNGEQAAMEFAAKGINSSTLTILIDTPDGQHAECAFDLLYKRAVAPDPAASVVNN